jgi:hypothetical protein
MATPSLLGVLKVELSTAAVFHLPQLAMLCHTRSIFFVDFLIIFRRPVLGKICHFKCLKHQIWPSLPRLLILVWLVANKGESMELITAGMEKITNTNAECMFLHAYTLIFS